MKDLIQTEKFKRKNEKLTADVITCKLNANDRALLEESKKLIEQTKDSTALKQLAWIGAKVLREEKTSYLLGVIFNNKRKNLRLGIVDFN